MCVSQCSYVRVKKMKLLWGPIEAEVSPDQQQNDLSRLQEIKINKKQTKASKSSREKHFVCN